MDTIKSWVTRGILTLIIGGTAYTISQSDVIKNFADDTGMTQEQAEQYINNIPEEELASWDEIGRDFIEEGQTILSSLPEIDCINYEYEWESVSLTCFKGRMQIEKLGNDSVSLGQSYIKLGSDSASKEDISRTISLIDQVNLDYEFEIVSVLLDWSTIDDSKKTNSYNKALLKAALESE